ncbi:PaaI family thioesterase [Lutibaculum baratangense]|uniref:Phenylacetic acid degradation-related protein n=1 Tax=Lutibaculum baratangense AMV1 TaxID=631454 RepID=V4RAU1_9HYPH|nr:PaaI family thioesterase [Lutibaculum baratangense]ESR23296.1 Phenylacetic acid degradation-related protein [Lutibaculum baratangense AMV1]
MDGEAAPPRMSAAEIERFLETEFPQMHEGGRSVSIESVRRMGAVLRMAYHERHLRPGGTVSGPAMMALADYAMYVAVLAQLGPVALAVTTNLSINFLRRPARRDMLADCTIMKLGRRLAVGEVALRSEGEEDLAAHVVTTYSLPGAVK